MLVKALANECDINFLSTSGSDLLSISVDDNRDSVRNIFDKARRTTPCILLIEELDFICKFLRKKSKGMITVTRSYSQDS